MPTTKAQYGQTAHPKPASLFSHNDQQNTWQALAPEGATRGWGGRMGDLLASMNGKPVFTCDLRRRQCGVAGRASRSSNTRSAPTAPSAWAPTATAVSSARPMSARRCSASSRRTRGTHVFERDLAALGKRSIDAELALRTALKPASDAALRHRAGQRQLQRQQRPEAAVRQPADRREVLQLAGAAAADRGAHDRRQQRRRRAGASARCSSSAWAASTRTTCRTATTPT